MKSSASGVLVLERRSDDEAYVAPATATPRVVRTSERDERPYARPAVITEPITVDVNEAVNPWVAVRINGMYENSGGFRDYFDLETYRRQSRA